MVIRLIDDNWGAEFEKVSLGSKDRLRIICPFIKLQALKRLLIGVESEKIEVITRFNLADFANRVSDISALRHLLKIGANVRGIKGLHTKLYIFGDDKTILTSANLTQAAMTKNSEFGFVSNDANIAAQCHTYFGKLWSQSHSILDESMLNNWETELRNHLSKGVRKKHEDSLPDYGDTLKDKPGSIMLQASTLNYDGAEYFQAFVKFLGEGDNRSAMSSLILDEVKSSGCHWAVAYPNSQRPRQVKDGATMFIARLTYNPNDIIIFGRATAISHDEERDNATAREIEERSWKSVWGRYIRVYDAEFIAGDLSSGLSLNSLMSELEAKSFVPTKRNMKKGSGNTNPRLSYQRKPSVELSEEGFHWLNGKFEEALNKFGSIPEYELSQLDWPDFESTEEVPSFHLRLGKEYYNKGHFNPPAEYAETIAGGAISLLLGENKTRVQGMSQVYEANNFKPRIFGYEPLRDWFSEEYKQGDEITVTIVSKNQLWLH